MRKQSVTLFTDYYFLLVDDIPMMLTLHSDLHTCGCPETSLSASLTGVEAALGLEMRGTQGQE